MGIGRFIYIAGNCIYKITVTSHFLKDLYLYQSLSITVTYFLPYAHLLQCISYTDMNKILEHMWNLILHIFSAGAPVKGSKRKNKKGGKGKRKNKVQGQTQ